MDIIKIFSVLAAVMIMTLSAERLNAVERKTLVADIRQRPPEMVVHGESFWAGPLIDILQEAVQRAGYQIQFQVRQFQGSLRYLERGEIDILPRAICTRQRATFMDFLGPVGYEEKEILFLVKPGQEESVRTFDDLKDLTVGVKRGTVYFDAFDACQEIVKIESHDDENLVRMFAHNRFQTMIILDRNAVESALRKYQISEYAYARYRKTLHIGIYYGILRGHPATVSLQRALENLVISGRVKAIYASYGLEPPNFDHRHGFEPCFQEEME
ncbi:amino acid ABC transporter substrate-binding protein [candidate division KSB3 bacterium]|uniref:Amino acid ABC transporter substrate-binding protein n=1 Tax=candidate division KSB3 bacterium TaxID=2044937 RepID=A0A2G6E1S8_9BACT|nr:MAG: amino acid ABC transporter substrate-binding protein [candidate division KSB3 bacterium]PIE28639.1 MAG: amino acid ABC transporter substrate-binding protein [candidate division KSB3 bacterium]